MSTNGMTTWAVDLKDIGAIYPFQGAEAIMVIILLVVWIGWMIPLPSTVAIGLFVLLSIPAALWNAGWRARTAA